MYHGIIHLTQQTHYDRYIPGLGTLPHGRSIDRVERHLYECDHCGTAYHFPEAAEEPFYCRSTTCQAEQREVSITPKPWEEASMARQKYLEWAKTRALGYCDAGNTEQAFASMVGDLREHPETANHPGIPLGMMQMMAGHLTTPNEMRTFLQGFH